MEICRPPRLDYNGLSGVRNVFCNLNWTGCFMKEIMADYNSMHAVIYTRTPAQAGQSRGQVLKIDCII